MPLSVYLDLTAPIQDGLPGVRIETARTIEKDGWNATTLNLYSHSGTHMDAPLHFACSDQTIDQIPLARCLSRAWMVRIHEPIPRQLIEVADLGEVAGKLCRGDSIILQTGWARHRDDPEIFRHGLPRISEELARWMVDRGVNLVGVEPPSVADVNNIEEVTRIHQILLGGDVIIVEGLTGLEKVGANPFRFGAFPLRIAGGDGCPCRAFAMVPVAEQSLPFAETMASLPVNAVADLTEEIVRERQASGLVIAVLDDDPTGTQTVHDVNVYTRWNPDILSREMREGCGLFFLLTNTRAMVEEEAVTFSEAVGRDLRAAAEATGRRLVVISRGDSTLRGHYPVELSALGRGLGLDDAPHVLAPFFEAGGRFTLEDIHFVREGDTLLPAGETAFARDATFSYTSSNLRAYVREKFGEDIPDPLFQSISLESVRSGEAVRIDDKARFILLNAATEDDLQAPALAFLKATGQGGSFLFRTAASFVRVIAGIRRRPLLEAEDLQRQTGRGGLFVVGSHVPVTTRQLERLLSLDELVPMEIEVPRLLGDGAPAYCDAIASELEKNLAAGRSVAAFTSRKLERGSDREESLRLSIRVSDFLVQLVAGLKEAPRFLVAKGGITSCELARNALRADEARVLGQVLPGVPVWRLGRGSRFEGLPYILFPGNVGDDDALLTVARKLI